MKAASKTCHVRDEESSASVCLQLKTRDGKINSHSRRSSLFSMNASNGSFSSDNGAGRETEDRTRGTALLNDLLDRTHIELNSDFEVLDDDASQDLLDRAHIETDIQFDILGDETQNLTAKMLFDFCQELLSSCDDCSLSDFSTNELTHSDDSIVLGKKRLAKRRLKNQTSSE